MSDLVTLVTERAAAHPDRLFARFLATGESEGLVRELSYGELETRSRAVAAELLARGCQAEPVVLLFLPGLEFLSAFLGCAYAGAIAVPLAPPNAKRLPRTLPRIEAVVTDSRARFVLTSSELAPVQGRATELAPRLASATWIVSQDLDLARAEGYSRPDGVGQGLCHLQYTSGSTGSPKGVRISHQNVLHNLELIKQAVGQGTGEEAHEVSWLPGYHDMGLIGGLLQPLYHDASLTLLAPVSFLRRPLRWLEAISRYRGTASGAPDFAYALVAKKASDAEVAALDLSSWTTAFCGAEPIRPTTAARFVERFAPAGLPPDAFAPTYGLAEATLIVAMGEAGQRTQTLDVDPQALAAGEAKASSAEGARRLVSSGRILGGCRGLIVDPETRAVQPANATGELWIQSGSVAEGYWERPEVNQEVFAAQTAEGLGPFLRTGDLAFLDPQGELFVVGRLKDVLIVHGRNVFPQDLEESVEACQGVRSAAAFGIEVEDEERVVLAVEVDRRSPEDLAAIHREVLRAIARDHELAVFGVALVKRGGLPVTTSGKIQRFAARAGYLEGSLPELARFEGAAPAGTDAGPDAPTRLRRAHEIADWLQGWIAGATGYDAGDVDPDMPLVGYGLDSSQAVELASELGARVGQELDPALTFDYPTIREISGALAASGGSAMGEVPPAEPTEGEAPAEPRPDAGQELKPEPVDSAPTAEVASPSPAEGASTAPEESATPPADAPSSQGDTEPNKPELLAATPPLSSGNLLLLDLAFLVFATIVVGPALLAAAASGRLLLQGGLPWQGLVVAAPLLAALGLFVLALLAWVLRLLLPRPQPGIHPLQGPQGTAWGLNFVLQRVVSLPLWRPVFMSSGVLRWLLLRALGAEVPFRLRTAMDAEILDAHLLTIGEDAMLSGGTSVSAHLTAGDQLHLARVTLGRGVELWAGASVALGCELGEGTRVGVRTMILPHVKVGPNCSIGSFGRVGEGTKIGEGATLGDEVIVGRGCVVDAGASVPDGTRLAPGSRVRAS
jgi:acyl-CoA synthetase (AMP-forming)/AMP-acid ligase II/acetyltransferase-like isoleucine patch superfamily enzyme/acyl carrier protein